MSRKALVVNPDAPAAVAFADIDEPSPAADQAVVEVRHVSVNFGEMWYAATLPAGTVMGYDAAGVVVAAAADGSGPPVGSRVAAFGPGAWARRAVFGTDSIAPVPDTVDLADAAAIPMVGITALRTLRAVGSVLGKRVMVTGASGGVGRAAIQLAARAGGHVVAVVGSEARGAGLAELGAAEVVVGMDEVGEPVDVVMENLGGPYLVKAWQLLAPGGNLQSIGWASKELAVIPVNGLFSLGAAKTLQTFADPSRPAADMSALLALVAKGRLSAEVGWRGGWEQLAEASEALFGRTVPGKVVLDVTE